MAVGRARKPAHNSPSPIHSCSFKRQKCQNVSGIFCSLPPFVAQRGEGRGGEWSEIRSLGGLVLEQHQPDWNQSS